MDNAPPKIKSEAMEIDLLLEAIFRKYGHDLRSYVRSSLTRRIRHFMSLHPEYRFISEMIPKVLHDQNLFSDLLKSISVTVTEMFRDPFVYRALRDKVIPLLRTWPQVKIWHAGCASGEEVYSLAILLKEERVYDKATIYATDFNDASLRRAQEGIYEIKTIKQATKNYQQANGKASLTEYYHAKYDAVIMNSSLRERITFANHNLAVDQAFAEVHLILCRNVLIYFNRELQDRVLEVFAHSLVHGGLLCLGTSEETRPSKIGALYRAIDNQAKIYKKEEVPCNNR